MPWKHFLVCFIKDKNLVAHSSHKVIKVPKSSIFFYFGGLCGTDKGQYFQVVNFYSDLKGYFGVF